MRSRPFQSKLTAILLCLGGSISSTAEPFAAPAEGPVAFRRDLVPLDADTLATLSRQVETLARGMVPHTPEERRGIAQMLALAKALDPANSAARELLDSHVTGEDSAAAPDPAAHEKAKVRIWQLLAWLETPEAGADGRALGACLHDIMNIADPGHPRAVTAKVEGEKGAWSEWVPEVTNYEPVVAAMETPEEVSPEVAAEEPVKLTAAMVTVPLWTVDRTGSLKLAPVPVRLGPVSQVGAREARRRFALLILADQERRPLRTLLGRLETGLAETHGNLPPVSINLSIGDGRPYLFSRNGEAVSGAAFVLASAALTGREPSATILGTVREDGTFAMFPRFWGHLRSLSKTGGGRLVVPAEAADHLRAILALEEPEFFLRYEVLAASSTRELLDYAAKVPPAALAGASLNFTEIQAKADAPSVGQYLANRFVRQRLAEIAQAVPDHLSARMLAIQGAGERPVFLPRKILASELRRVLAPMEWISQQGGGVYPLELSDRIDPTYERCRAEIDRLERYVDTADRELFVKARDLCTSIRTLGRAYRVRMNSISGTQIVMAEQVSLIRNHQALLAELSALAGEAEAESAGETDAE